MNQTAPKNLGCNTVHYFCPFLSKHILSHQVSEIISLSENQGNHGTFITFQSQDHLTWLSLDKQKNEGHCEQQLYCSAAQENAGQFVNVSEKDTVLRTTVRKWIALPAQNSAQYLFAD